MIWKKNKKGLAAIVALMLVILFFFLGLTLAGPIQEVVNEAQDDADCSNSSISDNEKDGCTIMGLNAPLFIGTIFGIAAGFIALLAGTTKPPKGEKNSHRRLRKIESFKKNKKGSAFLSIVLTLAIFISGVLMVDDVMETVDISKEDLNCSQTDTISDSNKFSCLIVGGVVPYFIWALLSVTLGVAIGRAT